MKDNAALIQEYVLKILRDSEGILNQYVPLFEELDFDDVITQKKLLQSLSNTLQDNPFSTAAYMGTREGCFFRVAPPKYISSHLNSVGIKIPDETTSVVKVVYRSPNADSKSDSQDKQADESKKSDEPKKSKDEKETFDEWYFINDKNETTYHKGQKTTYDPRKRDWYKASLRRTTPTWTDIYIFTTTSEAGITVSKTLMKEGRIVGALATDITTSAFSSILSQFKIVANAQQYIIDDTKKVIASSLEAASGVKNDSLDKLDMKNIKDTVLHAAYDEYAKRKCKDEIVFFDNAGVSYICAITDFPDKFGKKWKMINVVPLSDFVGKIHESRNKVLVFSVLVVMIAILMAFRLAQRISFPIVQLAKDVEQIRDLNLEKSVSIASHIYEINDLVRNVAALKNSMRAFSNYIPRSLVHRLMKKKGEIHIGGKSKEITLMFSDIEGFTHMSEGLSAEDLVYHLSDYFEEMTSILMESEATIDKFIGDAIMAFWGAPFPVKDHAASACHAALLCQHRLQQKNLIWKREDKFPLPTRIGLHTGTAIVGNIGSSERMNYTAVGDNINFASRLEGLNKYYGTRVIISEPVYDNIKGKFLVRTLDKVAVKGKTKAIRIFELIAQKVGDDTLLPTEEQENFVRLFEAAYHLYLTRQFNEALDSFKYIDEHVRLDDRSVHIYLERCQTYIDNPPHQDWDGSYQLDVKY